MQEGEPTNLSHTQTAPLEQALVAALGGARGIGLGLLAHLVGDKAGVSLEDVHYQFTMRLTDS